MVAASLNTTLDDLLAANGVASLDVGQRYFIPPCLCASELVGFNSTTIGISKPSLNCKLAGDGGIAGENQPVAERAVQLAGAIPLPGISETINIAASVFGLIDELFTNQCSAQDIAEFVEASIQESLIKEESRRLINTAESGLSLLLSEDYRCLVKDKNCRGGLNNDNELRNDLKSRADDLNSAIAQFLRNDFLTTRRVPYPFPAEPDSFRPFAFMVEFLPLLPGQLTGQFLAAEEISQQVGPALLFAITAHVAVVQGLLDLSRCSRDLDMYRKIASKYNRLSRAVFPLWKRGESQPTPLLYPGGPNSTITEEWIKDPSQQVLSGVSDATCNAATTFDDTFDFNFQEESIEKIQPGMLCLDGPGSENFYEGDRCSACPENGPGPERTGEKSGQFSRGWPLYQEMGVGLQATACGLFSFNDRSGIPGVCSEAGSGPNGCDGYTIQCWRPDITTVSLSTVQDDGCLNCCFGCIGTDGGLVQRCKGV